MLFLILPPLTTGLDWENSCIILLENILIKMEFLVTPPPPDFIGPNPCVGGRVENFQF